MCKTNGAITVKEFRKELKKLLEDNSNKSVRLNGAIVGPGMSEFFISSLVLEVYINEKQKIVSLTNLKESRDTIDGNLDKLIERLKYPELDDYELCIQIYGVNIYNDYNFDPLIIETLRENRYFIIVGEDAIDISFACHNPIFLQAKENSEK